MFGAAKVLFPNDFEHPQLFCSTIGSDYDKSRTQRHQHHNNGVLPAAHRLFLGGLPSFVFEHTGRVVIGEIFRYPRSILYYCCRMTEQTSAAMIPGRPLVERTSLSSPCDNCSDNPHPRVTNQWCWGNRRLEGEMTSFCYRNYRLYLFAALSGIRFH